MACNEWNDAWVAQLYGELEPAEENRLNEHLVDCGDCRARIAGLTESRALLRDAAPEVPAAARVIVMQPRRAIQPVWAFAAGMTCAMLIFALGLVVGPRIAGGPVSEPDALADFVPLAEYERSRQQLESRLDGLQGRPVALQQPATVLTRDQLQDELTHLQRNIQVGRARDFQFLLEEISAAEWRTGSEIDRNRFALQSLALANNPYVSER